MIKNVFLAVLVGVVTNSNAQSWTAISSGTSDYLNNVTWGDSNTVYVTGPNKTLLKSTNSGYSFTPLNTSFLSSAQFLHASFFVSNNVGYVAGGAQDSSGNLSNGFIYKTTNGGASWALVLSGVQAAFNSIKFHGAGIGYAIGGEGHCTAGGVVYQTTDSGAHWTQLYSSGSTFNYLTDASFYNDSEIYVCGSEISSIEPKIIGVRSGSIAVNSNYPSHAPFYSTFFKNRDTGFVTQASSFGSILKTTDGAATWQPVISAPLLFCIRFVSANEVFAVGDNGTIMHSLDGGVTWSNMTSGTTVILKYAAFHDATHGIAVGNSGTILRYGYPSTVSVGSVVSNEDDFTIYPNPANNDLLIQTTSEDINDVSITNIMGENMLHKAYETKDIHLDISGLAVGLYVVTIKGSAGVHVRHLSVQR